MLYPRGAAPMSAALSSPAPRRALAAVCVAYAGRAARGARDGMGAPWPQPPPRRGARRRRRHAGGLRLQRPARQLERLRSVLERGADPHHGVLGQRRALGPGRPRHRRLRPRRGVGRPAHRELGGALARTRGRGLPLRRDPGEDRTALLAGEPRRHPPPSDRVGLPRAPRGVASARGRWTTSGAARCRRPGRDRRRHRRRGGRRPTAAAGSSGRGATRPTCSRPGSGASPGTPTTSGRSPSGGASGCSASPRTRAGRGPWSVPSSITLLFTLVSSPWMDRRMLSRHPVWAERMSTSALVPWPRRG